MSIHTNQLWKKFRNLLSFNWTRRKGKSHRRNTNSRDQISECYKQVNSSAPDAQPLKGLCLLHLRHRLSDALIRSLRQSDVLMRSTYRPASIRDLGSRRSRNASPMKLKARTANITVTAGKSTRCGASKRCARASFSIDPQLAVGGGTPSPRKLIVASARTAPAMPMAACTITG